LNSLFAFNKTAFHSRKTRLYAPSMQGYSLGGVLH
jgi:hypothetical protein